MGPYGVSAIQNGIVPGYSANFKGELIILNIIMNDYRNYNYYRCHIMQNRTIRSNTIALYVAGEYIRIC